MRWLRRIFRYVSPAAGSAKGNGQAERDYFKKCVDNGGNVDDDADKDKK